jgi:hypothetical protein
MFLPGKRGTDKVKKHLTELEHECRELRHESHSGRKKQTLIRKRTVGG